MKITFVLSTIVALAATFVSAAPTGNETRNTWKSIADIPWHFNSKDPWVKFPRPSHYDLTEHRFALTVDGAYYNEMDYKKSEGNKKNNYLETRNSNDGGYWSVTHDERWPHIVMRTQKVNHEYHKWSTIYHELDEYGGPGEYWEFEYYDCIDWWF
ncbi:hypothetical protein BGX23_008928 [Mortierella sp. AD031]|nr:hypothetical protein BGX23_008928 [Mortierella sp. AD031]KAG0204445.1 hypothetical protein BGX33_008530 [Mortierella sp. NVP41]